MADGEEIDDGRRRGFRARVVRDLAAAVHLATVIVGDRLGLYVAMADGAPVTAGELAARTGTEQRYVAAWLEGQSAAGYLEPAGDHRSFRLPSGHADVLMERDALGLPAMLQLAASLVRDEPLVTEAYRTGAPFDLAARHPDLLRGEERWRRSAFTPDVVGSWLAALPEVAARLDVGAVVVDLGCGAGVVARQLAAAYPASDVLGLDERPEAIDASHSVPHEPNLRFELGTWEDTTRSGYDLVTCVARLQAWPNPGRVAAGVRSILAAGGTWLVVVPEPGAHAAARQVLADIEALVWALLPGADGSSPGTEVLDEAGVRSCLEGAGFSEVRRMTATRGHAVYAART